jgi:hypothetical protein
MSICINLSAQDIQPFLGTYHLEGMCEDLLGEDVFFSDERDIVIKEGSESDLLINIGASANFNDFEAFISNDSLFIPPQGWINYDGSEEWFQGKGKFENDSLFLNYTASGTFGAFECECKGKKTTPTNILYPSSTDKIKVYYDAVNQIIVIDGISQNQSMTFELFDIQGKAILRKTCDSNSSINVANLPTGVYLYRLLHDWQTVGSGKIIF